MSQHRRAVIRLAATSGTRRSRLLIGSVAALGASGLILGGIGVPVSAGDVNAVGNPYASAEVQDGCVTAAAGTGGTNGSVVPQQGSDATVEATGEGTATVTVCREDLDGALPDDPAGSLPDDPGGIVADELDDIVPEESGGSLEGEVVAIVTATLEGLPGGGDGSLPGDLLPDDLLGGLDGIVPDGGGSFPGDPGDLPGGLGGLVPDGSGIGPGDLFDRLAEIVTGTGNGGGPGGNGGNGGGNGGAPALGTSTNGSVSGSVVGGNAAARDEPTAAVLGTEVGDGAPALVGTSVSPGGTLPRTGGGLGAGVLRLIAFLGLGRGLVGLAKRR